MAITRQTRKARGGSSPSRLSAGSRPTKASSTTAFSKSGLTKELVALGAIPKPQLPKHKDEGPGYQGPESRISRTGPECSICAETQQPYVYPSFSHPKSCTEEFGRRQFPAPESLPSQCTHESNICRTCIARHTENQLSIDGKWHRVACLACRAHVGKAQLRKLVWKEDFKR